MKKNITDHKKIQIAIAGSTQHTLEVAKSLNNDQRFQLKWVLTPQPKKVGRKQQLISNPLHLWALELGLPYQLVNNNFEELNQELSKPDYLLVVDFGYIIPPKLLTFPKQATINLHPSKLPSWRGSSPGQFVLLSGETKSALSLITVTSKLDSGPIIAQKEFEVESNWTSLDYYQHSFALASRNIPGWINNHFQGVAIEKPQPSTSPTPLARKIKKADAFISWKLLKLLMTDFSDSTFLPQKILHSFPSGQLSENSLVNYFLNQEEVIHFPTIIERACRAFQPWPILWTTIPTIQGNKRMQILSCQTETINGRPLLRIGQVKIEGKNSTSWNEVKSILK